MQCYCAASRKLARRLTRVYEAELRPLALNPAQFELLATLRARPGISQAELAEALDVDQTTLSRNLKLAVANTWVTARTSAQDLRRAEYKLAAEGRLILKRALPLWQRARNSIEQELGPAAAIWRALDRLSSAADAVNAR